MRLIRTKGDLKRVLQEDNLANQGRCSRVDALTASESYQIRKYQKLMRLDEYYSFQKGIIQKVLSLITRRRKNKLGTRLGLFMKSGSFDGGLVIWHCGGIVVNGNAVIGKNCSFHGDNCIGNNGTSSYCPVIGDNVEFGVGAKAIGDITIADNVTIGAGAIVVKSCLNPGAVLVGVPAREL